MKNFIEKLNDIFNSITSKENSKPDTYAYETKVSELTIFDYYYEDYDGHLMFLDDEKMDKVRDVFLAFCSDFDFNYMESDKAERIFFEADRFELFALTDEMIKECFEGASFSEIRDEILALDSCSLHYNFKASCEEFFRLHDLWIAFNGRTEEIFFGKQVTRLETWMIEHNDDEEDNED